MSAYHASKDELPGERFGDYEARTAQMGDYYLKFEQIPGGFDDRELLKGLPDDACQSPHWGYVFKGRLRFRYSDGSTDEIGAGEAYYARPGHTFEVIDDAETVEFSPVDALDETTAKVVENLRGASGAE
jgi:hypothetical protein